MPTQSPTKTALAITSALFATSLLSGCLEHPVKDVSYESAAEGNLVVDVTPKREVDILFVIDNSYSMGDEQARLSANFQNFIERLEADKTQANYRIAITTTDTGNPRCGGDTDGSEYGAFVLSSCVDRLENFEASDGTIAVEACEDYCSAAFSGVQPLTTALYQDGDEASRPWIESLGGVSNLPEQMSTTQAFQCYGPQGVSGCGYESPLEATKRALSRTQDRNDPSYGFLRDGAILAVVVVTDEADCSTAPGSDSIFLPSGDRAFWEDPESFSPTSAVCWNAGVTCDDTGCQSANYTAEGDLTSEPGKAVMEPVDTYVDFLRTIKGNDDPVMVSVIAGVPEGYPAQAIPYGDSDDPEFQEDYGIGAGCTSMDGGTAIPPVRLKEFADQFKATGVETNLFSICAENYTPALDALATSIEKNLVPTCVPACVSDSDPSTPGIQANCTLTERINGDEGSKRDLPRCRLVEGTYEIPAGEDDCFIEHTGDALHPYCQQAGVNLEFEVLRQGGLAPRSGSTLNATCELSESAIDECPNLDLEQLDGTLD